jgi:vacuolar-type H+-ATPase subunit I/STV1
MGKFKISGKTSRITHVLIFCKFAILDRFKATIYPCPETPNERREMLNGVSMRLDELKTVLDQSLNLRKSLLVNSASNLRTWFCKVKKMKGVYHTLNMFMFDQKSMIGKHFIQSNSRRKKKYLTIF